MTDSSFYFKEKYRIPSVRLKNWDYSSVGYYYVTICVKNRECCLGKIMNRKMYLSELGKMVKKFWFTIPNHYKNVLLDEYILMPNHLHGIIVIENKNNKKRNNQCRDVINHVSTNKNLFSNITPMGKQSLGEIIRWFKGKSTYEIRKNRNNFFWQPRFYDHIIRNEKSLQKIREYIRFNPLNWDADEENPKNIIKY